MTLQITVRLGGSDDLKKHLSTFYRTEVLEFKVTLHRLSLKKEEIVYTLEYPVKREP